MEENRSLHGTVLVLGTEANGIYYSLTNIENILLNYVTIWALTPLSEPDGVIINRMELPNPAPTRTKGIEVNDQEKSIVDLSNHLRLVDCSVCYVEENPDI